MNVIALIADEEINETVQSMGNGGRRARKFALVRNLISSFL